jgi:hypothetical protein
MRERFFLVLLGSFGSCLPAAIAAGGCGSVAITPPGGVTGGGGGTGGEPPDATSEFVDPGCPDAGAKMTDFTCDAFHQNDGDCPAGQGCYIFATPPPTPCGQEVCDTDCSAGFTCVVSGSGVQCSLLCQLTGNSGCPEGMVCEPIDVQGFGGCL